MTINLGSRRIAHQKLKSFQLVLLEEHSIAEDKYEVKEESYMNIEEVV